MINTSFNVKKKKPKQTNKNPWFKKCGLLEIMRLT